MSPLDIVGLSWFLSPSYHHHRLAHKRPQSYAAAGDVSPDQLVELRGGGWFQPGVAPLESIEPRDVLSVELLIE